MPHFDQARYQVRCEWGLAALRNLAACDIVIVVDVPVLEDEVFVPAR